MFAGKTNMSRPPTPTALKVLAGNPGHRPLNKDEPQFGGELGEPPEWLDEDAKRVWFDVGAELTSAGVTKKVERWAFACFAQACSNLQHARATLAKQGSRYISGIRGPQKHPAVADERECMELIKKFASEFGLTPSSRTKIRATPKTEGNPFHELDEQQT
jgi:P27 family predicted phage terminase small subunit